MKKKLLFVTFVMFIMASMLLPLFAQSQGETLKVLIDPGEDDIILNPYTASDSNSIVIMLNLYEGLFEYDHTTSEAKPALVEKYSTSEDGLTWTFYLRSAKFSDGAEITSKTFADSWNYMIGGPLASNLDFVGRTDTGKLDIQTPEKNVLVVNLKYPVSYLPSLLCQPCLAAIKDTTSYSGAYTLQSQSDELIKLRRNPYYWDAVKTDFVDILIGEDNYKQEFLNGNIQWSMAALSDASDYMVLSRLYATTFFYFSAKEGAYADENIRKALIDVIPWDIIRSVQGSLLESSSIVPESGLQANISDDILWLLAAGGYPYGEKALPVINMAITRGAQNAQVAELIAELWSKTLGITVILNTVPLTVFASTPELNPYDFCTITWIGDYFDPMAFLQLFASDSSFNLANFSNEEYDALLDAATNAADEVTRKDLLLQAEQVLLDSGVVIPMSTAFATNFVRNDLISGWETNPLDIHPFKEISFNN
jgi:ABC-type oligopeptide transport system substrate-binding subunit